MVSSRPWRDPANPSRSATSCHPRPWALVRLEPTWNLGEDVSFELRADGAGSTWYVGWTVGMHVADSHLFRPFESGFGWLSSPVAVAYTASMCATAIATERVDPSGARVRALAQMWARTVVRTAGVSVAVESSTRVDWNAPLIVMANHQSLFDIPILFSVLPKPFGMIAKQELYRVPLLAGTMRALGCVPIDRGSRRGSFIALKNAARVIKSGVPLVIFPEGTRSRTGELSSLKQGPFHLVEMAGAPVVPVGLLGTRNVLPSGSVRLRPAEVRVRIGDPIHLRGKGPAAREVLREEVGAALAELLGAAPTPLAKAL